MTAHGPDAKILPAELPAADELLSVLWQVVEDWHEKEHLLQDWDDVLRVLPPGHAGWAGLAELLQLINTFQWHEEDRSRAHDDDSEILASVKQSIDASNARRVKTIELFDSQIMQVLASAGLPVSSAPLHSESPASIVDRITVLALKLYHIREELSTAGGTLDEAVLHSRLESLKEQMDDLAGCLDGLFLDIAAGLRSIKLYKQVKVYMDPATGRYRSGLGD
ncbi:DUF4254 domain-containing protein [bacterium]|nr:DUF4254 domain-containing protein [bacterium]MBU1072867.1 DUF4254 domain-containing protein [bacterium]MBU1676157.1 DUF4254 domain-containing protein [bacterium]